MCQAGILPTELYPQPRNDTFTGQRLSLSQEAGEGSGGSSLSLAEIVVLTPFDSDLVVSQPCEVVTVVLAIRYISLARQV